MREQNLDKCIPQLYSKDKHDCCGCTACVSICPANAIEMVEDEEGFLYPQINVNKCIKCNTCIKICRFKRKQQKI